MPTDNDLNESEFLREGLQATTRAVNIRLREGEYQFDLAKTISSFELKLQFPDVKELIEKSYGKEKADDVQFVRKIQTILKKMEKSGIVEILPKKKPWELQKYALSSFRFQDVEKNTIALATDTEIDGALESLAAQSTPNCTLPPSPVYTKIRFMIPISILIVSYIAILWALIQPTINLTILVIGFCLAALFSALLGFYGSLRK